MKYRFFEKFEYCVTLATVALEGKEPFECEADSLDQALRLFEQHFQLTGVSAIDSHFNTLDSLTGGKDVILLGKDSYGESIAEYCPDDCMDWHGYWSVEEICK